MLKKIFNILLLTALIATFVFLFIFVKKKKSEVAISEVHIEIVDSLQNKFVRKSDIFNILKKKHPKLIGQNLEQINRTTIEKDIEGHKAVEKAEVYSLVDGTIKIRIWQREPVYRYFGKDGYYVDSHAEIMPLNYNFTKRVLIVTGNLSKERAKGEFFIFCKYLTDNEFWSKYIGQIQVESKDEIILVPVVGKFKIVLGDITNYELKLNKLKAFLDKAQENNIWGKYKYINLEYNNQIVCIK